MSIQAPTEYIPLPPEDRGAVCEWSSHSAYINRHLHEVCLAPAVARYPRDSLAWLDSDAPRFVCAMHHESHAPEDDFNS